MIRVDRNNQIFKVDPNVTLEEGDIVQFIVDDGYVKLTKSDGYNPIGYILRVFTQNYPICPDFFAEFELFNSQSVLYASTYESETYSLLDSIYVSSNGKFTNVQETPSHPVVGEVLEITDELKIFIY